ncbi:hypothetical protein [Spirosoma pollinicola]|uniref:Uncharacterized protein n=1 Tax=Spirosoma pollinicola TaxID=2057025 RepID=A0A2K8Z263_9BACT|nr:hypothetical protein [Spirosoma pollinicola]AUD03919.1 hypothetical protein CWM47_20085 [Spirosoma pollinicola]
MKPTIYFILAAVSILFSQCSGKEEPKIDFDKASIQLMSELEPQLVDTWKMQKVQINYQPDNYYQKKIPLNRDTTFQDFAILTVESASPARTSPRDLRRGEYNGTLQFRNKTYPIQFDLLANSEWLIDKKGPQASFTFSFNFPPGLRLTESEEEFLNNIGLMNDGYSLNLSADQRTMIWQGYNRGVERIDLKKL